MLMYRIVFALSFGYNIDILHTLKLGWLIEFEVDKNILGKHFLTILIWGALPQMPMSADVWCFVSLLQVKAVRNYGLYPPSPQLLGF